MRYFLLIPYLTISCCLASSEDIDLVNDDSQPESLMSREKFRLSEEEYLMQSENYPVTKRQENVENTGPLIVTRTSSIGSNVIVEPETEVKYNFGRELEPGDYIEVYGTYSVNTNFYYVKLQDSGSNTVFGISPRRRRGQTVLYTAKGRSWTHTVDGPYPDFQHEEKFKITIVLMDSYYRIYFNEKLYRSTYPFIEPLSAAKSLELSGGSEGFTWDKIVMPGDEKAAEYAKPKEMVEKVDELSKELTEKIKGKSFSEIKSYANSNRGTIKILTWKLMSLIQISIEQGVDSYLDFNDGTLKEILSNKEILEMLMTSGDVRDNKYVRALEILAEIIRQDPKDITADPLRLRLAVAIALTHSKPVINGDRTPGTVDWMSRYKAYLRWHDEGQLYQCFDDLSAWHLRYVVATRLKDDEIVWTRENTPENNDNPTRIGYGGLSTYNIDNEDGISVHSGADKFYYYQPTTMKVISEIGGVCGSKSQVGTGLCRAHGVPAVRCNQPSHAAYIWYQNGEWTRGNSLNGWNETGIQLWEHVTWETNKAYYFRAMNKAQKNREGYKLSEKMRISSKFADGGLRFEILEDATTQCPYNIAVWRDLENAIKEVKLEKDTVRRVLLPTLLSHREKMRTEDTDLVKEKEVVASDCFGDTSSYLTDSVGETALCRDENGGSFEIVLEKPSTVKQIHIKWWRASYALQYKIYAMSESGSYIEMRSQDDEERTGPRNELESHLEGWEMKTVRIKVDLIEGRRDWGKKDVYFGIRTFEVMGVPHDVPIEVLTDQNLRVTTNEGSSGQMGLVSSSDSTLWKGGSRENWIQIDLRKICILNKIELSWVEGAIPEKLEIILSVGDIEKTEVFRAEKPFNEVSLNGNAASSVRIEMKGDASVLREIKAAGMCYGAKDILKMKVMEFYKQYYYLRSDIDKIIDNMVYED